MDQIRETLSSNAIFHFTNSSDNLVSILKKGISPRYCVESFNMFRFGDGDVTDSLEFAVPMICFCDIPLSKIKYHLSFYGNYGIGFTKEWAVKNGVSPIMYIDPKSETTKSIQDAVYYFSKFGIMNLQADTTYQKILRLIRFTKPYEGKFWRSGKYLDSLVRFYDEREWRYVPDIRLEDDGLKPWVTKDDFLKSMTRARLNTSLSEKYSLLFAIDDIKYIIIEKEEDVIGTIGYLEEILKEKYSLEEIKKLSARIITKEQIEFDF